MRDDTKKVEEAVAEAPVTVETVMKAVEKDAPLLDWVDSFITEYDIRFDAWVTDGGESPILCIKAIRGDKVSRPAYINACTPHRRDVKHAIQSIVEEVLQK